MRLIDPDAGFIMLSVLNDDPMTAADEEVNLGNSSA